MKRSTYVFSFILYSPWAVRLKMSEAKLFFESLSLYSLSKQIFFFFFWRRLLIRIKLSLPLSCYIPSCLIIQLAYSYTFKIPPLSVNQSCEDPCCNFVLLTFLTYFTVGFWSAFCWLKLIRKNIWVLASWAYINVLNYVMKPVWVGILKLLSF